MKTFKTLLHFVILNFLSFSVYAQCPVGAEADAGTVTVNNHGGTAIPNVVCFGDAVSVTSNGDAVLPPGADAGLMQALYSCPPGDPNGPDSDPCWAGSYWINGDNFNPTNDGTMVSFLGFNTFWITAVTADDFTLPNHDADGDMCFDVNVGQAVMFTFLDELLINEIALDDCLGEVTLEIEGGYAELFGGSYTVSNTGSGSMAQSGANGEIITITGLADGDTYSFDVTDDGAGCTASFSGGPIDQEVLFPTFAYDPICYNSSGFPIFPTPAGGTFSFTSPPGDGASIDPSSGEISNATNLLGYDITYTVIGNCAPFSGTTIAPVLPEPSLPAVSSPNEFCEFEDTSVNPTGTGDFFTLYEDEFTNSALSTGFFFEMLDFVTPGEGPVTFFVSQSISGCESGRVSFTAEIFSQGIPLGPVSASGCEGEPIVIFPESGNGNSPGEFSFYGNPALTDFLEMGSDYTFFPTENVSIFVTEDNEGCETTPIEVLVTVDPFPTGVVGMYTCDVSNLFYSVIISTTNTTSITIETGAGIVIDNTDGTFTINNVPSGTALVLSLIGPSPAFCTTPLTVAAFECGCLAPAPPIDPTNFNICTGDTLPNISVTVPLGVYVNWYDAAIGGTLLFADTTIFAPPTAGTYYAEAIAELDDCVNANRTPVTIVINPLPVLVSVDTTCSADLLSYTVEFDITNADTIQVSAGVVSGGSGNFTVTGIPTGVNLTYTAFNVDSTCTIGPLIIDSPTCPCPLVTPLVTGPDQMICEGGVIPELSVTVGLNQVADWYDAAQGGNSLASNSLTFTPAGLGTYYIEARNTINQCVSTRDSITITSNPLPTFTIISTPCAADMNSYIVNINTTNTDVVVPSSGVLVDNGGGSFTISGILTGIPLSFTLTNNTTTCSDMFMIAAPDCSCAPVNAPIGSGDTLICIGDVIPAFEMMVDVTQTVDWYDAATGGNQLLANSTSFTPVMAGTFFAEARIIADGCISSVRTAVMLTIEPAPVFVSANPSCALDLQSYSVELQIDNAATLTIVGTGTVTNNGSGSFTVSDIPIGEDLTYTAFNASQSCLFGPETVTALLCPCPIVNAPMVSDTMICEGDPIPTLEVMVGMNETVDWYDEASDGIRILANSLSFTPALAGTYYLETRNTVNQCVSERDSISIIVNPIPTIVSFATCAADLLTYNVSITVSNTDGVLADIGTLVPDIDDNTHFDIINIPVDVDLNILLTNSVTGCELNELIPAADCSCPVIAAPVGSGDLEICSGDDIPALVVSVEAGQIVNWYDALIGGTLLLGNSESFVPVIAGVYYAEAVVFADGCISDVRTAVSFQINTQPILTSEIATCEPDLLSYTVALQMTGVITLDNDVGTLIDNGGGSFTITNIPPAMNLTYTAFNIDSTCTLGPVVVEAPDCSCPLISAPTVSDTMICDGDPIPTLEVMVGMNETVDWYDEASDGIRILANSLSFTPALAGTYYLETRNTVNQCVSERDSISIIVNPIPTIVSFATCAADLLTYSVSITVSNTDGVLADVGTLMPDIDDNTHYDIINIPAGVELNVLLTNSVTGCELNELIPAPDCSCPVIAAPISSGDLEICSGDDIPALVVSVEAGQIVNWYDAPVGGTLLLGNSESFVPTMAGVYYAEAVIAVAGCISDVRTAVSFQINTQPVLTSEMATCEPDLLSYTVELQITGAVTLGNDTGTLVDNGNGSFTISEISPGMNLTYTAFNADSTCTLGPAIINAPDCSCPLIAAPIPTVVDQAICEGDVISDFIVSVGNNQTADWYDAEVDGNLELEASLTFTPSVSITLYVEARDTINNCRSERVAVMLAISPIPSFVVMENNCADNLLTYELTISVTNANVVNANLGDVLDNQDGTFTVSGIPAGQDVQISLLNEVTTCVFTDMVIAPDCSCPTIEAPLGLVDMAICEGETLPVFTATVGDDQTVNWYDVAIDGDQILTANTTFAPSSSGTFYAETIMSINGCISSSRTAVSLAINENPTLAVTNFNLPTCNEEDGLIELEAAGGLTPYTYQLNSELFQEIPTYSNLAASNYDLIVEDMNGCRDSIVQNLISPEDVFADAGENMELTCLLTIATLDGSASDQGVNIEYQWLDPNGNPIADATGNQLDVQVGGIYTLMVSNTVSECVRTAEVVVTENNELLEVEAGEQQNITCDSETVNLVGTVAGGGSLQFQWTASQGGNIVGDPSSLSIVANATGLYHLGVLNTDTGCPGIDSVIVTELLPEDLDITIEVNSPACLGDGNGNISVQSNNPDAALLFSLEDSPFTASTVYSNLAPGNYLLQIEDVQGCISDSLLSIEQGTEVLLDILTDIETPGDIFIKLGESAFLEAETNLEEQDFATIQWTPAEFLICDTCLTTFTDSLQETTLFSLQVVDNLGCTASDDVRVFVDRKRHIFVPNAFSPNGDDNNEEIIVYGGNDVLMIKSFKIFDRWGELVFEEVNFLPNDPNNAWTGRASNNEPLNTNVYVYLLEVDFIDGETEIFAGDIILLK